MGEMLIIEGLQCAVTSSLIQHISEKMSMKELAIIIHVRIYAEYEMEINLFKDTIIM